MEDRMLKYKSEYLATLYGGTIEVDDLIKTITDKKNEIIETYPDAKPNTIDIEFVRSNEYDDVKLYICYARKETDEEYSKRIKEIEKKKISEINSMKRVIDSNKEEAINYLKSIGAI